VLNKSAKPARMKRPCNSVPNLTRVIWSPTAATSPAAAEKRHGAELDRTATAAFEDHQIAVIERACAHPLAPTAAVIHSVEFAVQLSRQPIVGLAFRLSRYPDNTDGDRSGIVALRQRAGCDQARCSF
jgi:hypothetical protein